MDAPRLTSVLTQAQSASVCNWPLPLVARGWRSLMNVTLWPMNTSSSSVTPSQIKVWLEILQRLADLCAFLDLHEGADFHVVADFTTVEVGEIVDADVVAQLDVGRDALKGLRS